MQFARRLRAMWSWLPAFRAVAETEHLPTAARELNVVPSALSRSVHLLEEELGTELFDRSGKGLVLNDVGRVVLAGVRDAMRMLDEVLTAATADELRGTVTAVATGDLAALVLAPAQASLAGTHPDLVVEIEAVHEDVVQGLLLHGDADVALLVHPHEHPDLSISHVATWSRSIYAGRDSGIAAAGARTVAVGSRAHDVDDGWPIEIARTIGAWVPDERAALETCARSSYLTIAYDAVASATRTTEPVTRVDEPAIPGRAIYLVHRRPVATHRRTDALVQAIRAAVGAVQGQRPGTPPR